MPSTAQRSKKAKPRKARKPVEVIVKELVPKLVCYYLDGWRYGYRESTKGSTAIIRPIPPLGAARPNTIKVPIEDIKEEL
jgi:hypothetical protein